jgi:hypothetical protein
MASGAQHQQTEGTTDGRAWRVRHHLPFIPFADPYCPRGFSRPMRGINRRGPWFHGLLGTSARLFPSTSAGMFTAVMQGDRFCRYDLAL